MRPPPADVPAWAFGVDGYFLGFVAGALVWVDGEFDAVYLVAPPDLCAVVVDSLLGAVCAADVD